MRKLLFFVTLGFLSLQVFGQEENKIRYGGMQQLSLIAEEGGIRIAPNLINGVRYKNWFAGVGVTYEVSGNYSFGVNTVPLYLDTRYYFGNQKMFFAAADIGANFLLGNRWLQDDEINHYKKYVGYFGGLGLGVRARLSKSLFYSFDVTYNFKQTRYDRRSRDWQNRWTEEYNNYKQRRILFRFGLEI